jgi:hypothetical protein
MKLQIAPRQLAPSETWSIFPLRLCCIVALVALCGCIALDKAWTQSISVSTPANGSKIGSVKTIHGDWCRPRRSSPLRARDSIFWDDSIHYCNGSIQVTTDYILIEFDRTPSYEQKYECATAGVCDGKQNIWVQGAYKYGNPPQKELPTTISKPPLRTAVPDIVAPVGSQWQKELTSNTKDKTLTFCLIDPVQKVGINPEFTTCVKEDPARSSTAAVEKPGLYAVYLPVRNWYLVGHHKPSLDTPPDGLLVLTAAQSDVLNEWAAVPAAYRFSSDPQVIQERRLYMLDLYNTEPANDSTPLAPTNEHPH